jgi:hypothetical protein
MDTSAWTRQHGLDDMDSTTMRKNQTHDGAGSTTRRDGVVSDDDDDDDDDD